MAALTALGYRTLRLCLAQAVSNCGFQAGGLYGHYTNGELVVEVVVKAALPGNTRMSGELDF